MSRTYKDKPNKLKFEPWDKDRVDYILYYHKYINLLGEADSFPVRRSIQVPTTKTKKRKVVDTEDHWMSTPSEWTRIMMNKPQRREGSLWEREVVKCQVSDLEEVDKPSVSRKPHIYYW